MSLKIYTSLALLVFAVLIAAILWPRLTPQSSAGEVIAEPGLIDLQTVIPEDRILLPSLTSISPDQKYTAFVTAQNLGFSDSTLWVANNYGDLTKIDYQIDLNAFYAAMAWNKDSTKFAYLRIYPTEIVTVDVKRGFYRTVVLSKVDDQDKNILNPSISYQGQAYLKWNDDDTIEFENMQAIPAQIYTVAAETKEVEFKQNIDLAITPAALNIQIGDHTAFFSQRDPAWEAQMLGDCDKHTIGSAGCAITAISMAFQNLGIAGASPGILNKLLQAEGGYVNGCDVAWYIASSLYKGITFKGAYSKTDFERLDYELSLGHEVILGFNKVPYTKVQHWVLVRKKENGKYYISDPWGYTQDALRTLDDLGGEYDHMIVYMPDSI